jgi:hypothetical protein
MPCTKTVEFALAILHCTPFNALGDASRVRKINPDECLAKKSTAFDSLGLHDLDFSRT